MPLFYNKKSIKRIGRFLIVPAICFLMSGTAMAVEADAVETDLHEVIARGLPRNPGFIKVLENKESAAEGVNQATALYLPSVDIGGQAGIVYDNAPGLRDQRANEVRRSLTATQMLFDGFAAQAENARQDANLESSSQRVNEAGHFIALDIVEAYLTVMQQRDLQQLARANVEDHRKLYERINGGYGDGTMTIGDVAQARARLAQARASLITVESDLRQAETFYLQKTSEMPGTLTFPKVPRDSLPSTIDDAVVQAIKMGPTFLAKQSDTNIAEAAYDSTGASLLPRVDLQVSGSNSTDRTGLRDEAISKSAVAVMRWNLYRGGGDIARQRDFGHRLAAARADEDDTERRIEKQVRDTWFRMQNAHDRAEEYKIQADENVRAVQVYLDQFDLNRRTLIDVLDGYTELFASRSSRINAMYSEVYAVYSILAQTGGLLKALNITLPSKSTLKPVEPTRLDTKVKRAVGSSVQTINAPIQNTKPSPHRELNQ